MAEKGIGSFEEYRALTLSAVNAYNARDFEKARVKFTALSAANPANITVHEILCALCLRAKDLSAAEKEYAIILRLAEEQHIPIQRPRTFNELVAEAGDESMAVASYQYAIDDATDDPVLSVKSAMRLSHIYMARGDYREAETILARMKERLLQGAG
ncbi:MAG: hypothetical protein AABZ39_07080 [Spirochaetota bacterium]